MLFIPVPYEYVSLKLAEEIMIHSLLGSIEEEKLIRSLLVILRMNSFFLK